jgi:Predicted EndoIII-related endonuclease
LDLSVEEIEKLIYPVGFYKRKARQIQEIAKTIIEKYGGKVPNDIEELLKIKGVGRKTANLVITEAYDDYGICVDTHVHRISNRLGWVKTKTPEQW